VSSRAWIAAFSRDAEAEAVEADIRAELEAHLALAEEALRGEGRTPEQARREARERFGDFERTLRACRRERMGGRLVLVRIQWALIALLTLSTLGFALYGRDRALASALERERAMAQAADAQALLMELQARNRPEPVEQIVVSVGDTLTVHGEDGVVHQATEVQIDGQALFEFIGWLPVAGKSRPEVEELLTARYAPFYESPHPVYVIVKSPN
jgi:hypothetical protein